MENTKKDGEITKPASWIRKSTRLTSVNFDAELHDQAKKNNISLKDAIEFGISFKIGDKDGFDYPPSNLLNKLHKVIQHRNFLLSEVNVLREQIKLRDDDEDEKIDEEIEDLFNAAVKK